MTASGVSRCFALSVLVGVTALCQAQAAGYPETVPVDNPNNAADSTGYGSVSYSYRIGKYEVTTEEYCEFLNAVEKAGIYNLYRWQMAKEDVGGIIQSGEGTNLVYTVRPGAAKKPAVLMNWHETMRFCNWLSNGKGDCNLDKGPYTFTNEWGEVAVKMPNHAALAAGAKTQWVLASEDEWYKAAYFDPKKEAGTPGYWTYPVRGENPPDAALSTGGPCDVGTFTKSASPYGTYDQGGNVWEWNETREGGNCGVRGGSYWLNDNPDYMSAKTRYCSNPAWFIYDNYGFRVVALGGSGSEAKDKKEAKKAE